MSNIISFWCKIWSIFDRITYFIMLKSNISDVCSFHKYTKIKLKWLLFIFRKTLNTQHIVILTKYSHTSYENENDVDDDDDDDDDELYFVVSVDHQK